jgi:hypothetical protein
VPLITACELVPCHFSLFLSIHNRTSIPREELRVIKGTSTQYDTDTAACKALHSLYKQTLREKMKQIIILTFLLAAVASVFSFSPVKPLGIFAKHERRGGLFLEDKSGGNTDSDFPSEMGDDFKGSVDWDAEWKKVVASDGKVTGGRPGKDFYKSDVEITAIKAANQARDKAVKVGYTIKEATPDVRSLSGDWRVRPPAAFMNV